MFPEGLTTETSRHGTAAVVFFGAFLALGLLVVPDYGAPWDEEHQRSENGLLNYHYLRTLDREALCQGGEKYHGPAFELVLIVTEKFLKLRDTRAIYITRHLLDFLAFYLATWVFHGILRRRFESTGLALLGTLFLILSPRIFAEAFYNSKDLGFLSFFVCSLGTLDLFLRRPSVGTASLHALSCGFTIGVRLLGVVIPVATIGLLVARAILAGRNPEVPRVRHGLVALFVGAVVAFTILFWPVLWRNPLHHFCEAFREMSAFRWRATVLYIGEYVKSDELPWHYGPVWILVTTPLVYSVFFIFGMARLSLNAGRPWQMLVRQPLDCTMLLVVLVPPTAVILLHSTIYDGWRHLYFIYPSFLYLAMHGFTWLWEIVQRCPRPVAWTFVASTALSLMAIAVDMIRAHPFQHVYFNRLAGANLAQVKQRFEMDYWGLSCRQALEFIVRHDPSPRIRVYPYSVPGLNNRNLLPASERARLEFTRNKDEADYFMGFFRWHPDEYPFPESEVFSVRLQDAKLAVVQKWKR